MYICKYMYMHVCVHVQKHIYATVCRWQSDDNFWDPTLSTMWFLGIKSRFLDLAERSLSWLSHFVWPDSQLWVHSLAVVFVKLGGVLLLMLCCTGRPLIWINSRYNSVASLSTLNQEWLAMVWLSSRLHGGENNPYCACVGCWGMMWKSWQLWSHKWTDVPV